MFNKKAYTKLRLLIVEDNTQDAQKTANELEAILPENECSVILAYSWKSTIEAIKKYSPEIVLLNYGFKDIPGYDVLCIIKKEYPFISVIVMTPEGDRKTAIDVAKFGADGYVSKKYGFDGIVYAIQNVVVKKKAEIEVNRLQNMLNEELNVRKTLLEKTINEATKSLEEKNIKLAKIVEIGKILSSQRRSDDLLTTIIKEATDVLEADRTSLFIYDENKDELWSKIAEKSVMKEIRFNVNKGIAGHVAKTRKVLNIKNAYDSEFFNPEFDLKTGFHTKNMLCAPLESKQGKLVGIIEVINKKMASFEKEDEEIIRTFASLVAVVIDNAKLSEENLKRERMAAIGNMASMIVHDLRNPMTTIKGFAQLIASKAPDLAKHANIIMMEIDRLSNMANDLLEFSRGKDDVIEFEKLDCKDFFDEIFGFLVKDFEKRSIDFIHSIRFSGKIEINPDKIRRAILNIAGNARDAMEKGGTFNIDIFESADKKNLVISLADTGEGMPPNIKNNVFEAFVTCGKENGTGLGMAITKKIIDTHNGTINVESEVGKGTRFEIVLPEVQH